MCFSRLLFVLILLAALQCRPALADPDPPFSLPSKHELGRIRSGIIYTSKGAIYLELFPYEAPWHVANLKHLADTGFYRNLPFHLFEENYFIQCGAPQPGVLSSGPGYTLPAEFNEHKHLAGTLSMVRRPDDLDLDHLRSSHGSQIRIMLSASPHMNGQYTVFGRVIKGMEVVQSLRRGDKIKDLRVFVQKDR
jgi:peptidyl-prolyl cis-trans isomerase B (cyclophilin B)